MTTTLHCRHLTVLLVLLVELAASPTIEAVCLELVGSYDREPEFSADAASAAEVGVHAIQRQGNLLFLASGSLGVDIVDISDITQPEQIAFYDTLGEALDLKVAGNTVYVADGSKGLLTLDITDPLMPRGLDAIFDITDARGIDLAKNLVYVAANQQGVRVADVTNPLIIFEVGSFTDGDEAQDVTLHGDLAYLADGTGGLRILDISVPRAPFELAQLETTASALEVFFQGDRSYVTSSSRASIFEVSDPTMPRLLGTYDDCNSSGVVVDGTLGYVACGSEVHVLNLGDPSHIGVVAMYEGPHPVYSSIALSENFLFVGHSTNGLDIFDVSSCQNLLSDGFESGDLSTWSSSSP